MMNGVSTSIVNSICLIDVGLNILLSQLPIQIINNIISIMKILQVIGIVFFWIHYYITLTLSTLANVIVWMWKIIRRAPSQKFRISPFETTHSHVFAPLHQVIFHDGYVMQTHQFQTTDNATVLLWRIHLQNNQLTKPFPILMMHGLLDCSASWFLHIDKSRSLPYMLASQGYDVWIGNNRGNRVSKNCEEDDPEFWQYNFDHLVKYDQPALINGVLGQTGKEKLIYVGHSQGSTQFLLGLGLHSTLAAKITAFIGMGTVVSLENVESHLVLNILSRFYLLQLLNFLGFKKILVIPKVISRAVGVLIYNSKFHFQVLMTFIRLLCGFTNKNKISPDLFGVMITHQPGGSSANNAMHWVQCFRSGGIMKNFDFGQEKNMELYGRQTPPAYSLKHLLVLPFNTYLFKGNKDAVMSDKDFTNLVGEFNCQKIFTYDVADYNHLDYVWSETAYKDLYEHISQIVQREEIKWTMISKE